MSIDIIICVVVCGDGMIVDGCYVVFVVLGDMLMFEG